MSVDKMLCMHIYICKCIRLVRICKIRIKYVFGYIIYFSHDAHTYNYK
jgi:hypothetical protein